MGKIVNLNLFGVVDLLSGILLLYTASALPLLFANMHSWFLIVKGVGTVAGPINLRWFGLPFLIAGGGADVVSAAILATGTPPILADFKLLLAGILGIKGCLSLVRFIS